jgi:hypothetical protein
MSSDSESCESYETGTTTNTFASLRRCLASLCETLGEYDELAEGIQSHMATMEKPVTSVALAAFVQPTHLKEAPFRHERFRIRKEAQKLFDLEETASFRTLCKHVRDTLFREGCVGTDGLVRLTPDLAAFFGTEEPVPYLSLLRLEALVE